MRQLSLADELGTALTNAGVGRPDFMIGGVTRPFSLLRSLRGDDSSPDSDRHQLSTDADSGNSTAHSPDLLKSGSPLPYPGKFINFIRTQAFNFPQDLLLRFQQALRLTT